MAIIRSELEDELVSEAYLREMRNRLPEFARRAAAIPAGAPGSIEVLARIGRDLWEAREQAGFTRHDIADELGISVNVVRLLEVGLLRPNEIDNIASQYAAVLGRPELYNVSKISGDDSEWIVVPD